MQRHRTALLGTLAAVLAGVGALLATGQADARPAGDHAPTVTRSLPGPGPVTLPWS